MTFYGLIVALNAIHPPRNLKVPEDIAVVGLDDLPLAEALDSPLTGIRQPACEVGRQAMERLRKRIMEPTRSTGTMRLLPKRIVRRST